MLLRAAAPFALATLVAAPAVALDQEYVPEEDAGDPEETIEGWYHTANFGIGLSLGTSRDVVGQEDGATVTFSFDTSWRAELFRGQHVFRNTLTVNEAISRTPLIDRFAKTNDVLLNEAIWFYHLPNIDWFGPFARASLRTSILNGHDVQSNTVDYDRRRNNGNTRTLEDRERLLLTRPFQPTTFKESVGVFVEPSRDPALRVDVRLGLGARQTFADGNFVVTDRVAADSREGGGFERDLIIVEELETFHQAGSELAFEAFGASEEGDVTYRLGFEMMTPFYNSVSNSDLNAWEATNYEAGFDLGLAVREWASLSYAFNALKAPQLIDEWQVTNQLLLTITHTIRSTPESRGAEIVEEMEAEAAAEEGAEEAAAEEMAEEAAAEEAAEEMADDAADEAAGDDNPFEATE